MANPSDGEVSKESSSSSTAPSNNNPDLRKLLPHGTVFLDTQVSGHTFDLNKCKTGMLRGLNGRVFKPIDKPALGEREISFYENLSISVNPTDMELLRYTPAFYGAKEMKVFDKTVKFLELEDITHGMAEPCVMDIKIGRRTWDPLASSEKKAVEDRKYGATKGKFGFCIPGFQVYKLPSGELQRYGKDYGKKLDSETVVEALQIFLNGTNRPPCRDLIVRLLSILWKILALFREQRRYRFYSSSLLIVYDAKRLRHHLHRQLNNSIAESLLRSPVNRCKSLTIARSLGSLNQIGRASSPVNSSPEKNTKFSFRSSVSPKLDRRKVGSGSEISATPDSPSFESPNKSPILNRTIGRLRGLTRSISLQNCEALPEKNGTNAAKEHFGSLDFKPIPKKTSDRKIHKLCRTHSYSNNFDADIAEMKEDYAAILSELSSSFEEKQDWVRVYMIDFAHVFPALDGELDFNYLEGIENLIKILEKFLV